MVTKFTSVLSDVHDSILYICSEDFCLHMCKVSSFNTIGNRKCTCNYIYCEFCATEIIDCSLSVLLRKGLKYNNATFIQHPALHLQLGNYLYLSIVR